mmetsp:Transcript_3975/g.10768  ORF Transcript_3975/g.10768 Transcript_3975/m.10768 type:complete len:371 (-) Transcript_3975:82-1194(-)
MSWGYSANQGVQKPWMKNEQQQQRQTWSNPAAKTFTPTPKIIAPQRTEWKGSSDGDSWGANRPDGQKETPLPDGQRVDKTVRYLGKVTKYIKWSGYGWIELNDKGVLPGDKIFCFHKSLQSEDRFPFLVQDMEVELSLHPYGKTSAPGKIFVRAKNVSLPGGRPVAIQDQVDAEKKNFVGGQHLRYTGTLEWYSNQKKFGYVKMDDGFDLGGEPVPKDLKVENAEVNSGGKEIPGKMKDLHVEFSIWKTQKGDYRVYNMTLPGMTPITAEALEHRVVAEGLEFKGTVHSNWWQQGYGMIKLAAGTALPAAVQAKMKKTKEGDDLLYFRNQDIQAGQWMKKGMEVTFQVYSDDKGCGACDVAGPDRETMRD